MILVPAVFALLLFAISPLGTMCADLLAQHRSEERRVGKECRL